MLVRVLFFGQLKEIVGKAEDGCVAPEGARLEDVFANYAADFPRLAQFKDSVAAAINHEYASWDACVRTGDEVAFLPPVSGGQQTGVVEDICKIVRERIPTEEILASLKAPEDGATIIFEGIVRNHSRGKQTLYLEYEAYEVMALVKMREIGAKMREQFAIDRVAMVHRLGRLEIGETSVVIGVSAAHRAAAFDACRYGIDTLKRTVPIWKREYFADGAVWVDGEKPSAEAFLPGNSSTP
ncbi:MAG TPA: molybdenum cofactor biosynthesis protein MoaE [Candidatus Acidoferrales bacterium]|nr:molybdenum cofactor biosynthesis protein MoaE [Candidatus Acidoferrales bacterium]